jgi:hypothetical protein
MRSDRAAAGTRLSRFNETDCCQLDADDECRNDG